MSIEPSVFFAMDCRLQFYATVTVNPLMVHCFQYQGRTLSRFSEWRALMEESCPQSEMRQVFQQF